MKLHDIAVRVLREIAAREVSRNIHPEDMKVYERGLSDGNQILAEWVLEQIIKEEDNVRVLDEPTSERE